MDAESLKQYIGKIVRLTILNGYYFQGRVIDVADESFSMIDIKGKNVTLSPSNIVLIEEVA